MATKKKFKIGSKKGSNFERTLCKTFSKWASKGKSEDWFWRTPQSGGKATEKMKKGIIASDFAGDMMSINPKGRILTKENYFEFKTGYNKDIDLLSLLDKLERQKDPILIQWWKKMEKERKFHKKKRSLMIFKRDYKNACIAMSSKTWLMDLRNNTTIKYVILRYKRIYLVVLLLEDFLNAFKVEDICNLPSGTGRRLKCRRPIPTKTKLNIRRKK